MAKKEFVPLIFLIMVSLTSQEAKNFKIQFDYSIINTEDLYIKKLLRVEFEKISLYFQTLLQTSSSNYLYKSNKKNTDRIIQCENTNISLNYDKESIKKDIFLLVFPTIKTNVTKSGNNPNLIHCQKKGSISIVIILSFEYDSEKKMKRLIPSNLKNHRYQWEIIKRIFTSIGFNKETFSKKNIVNNILIKNAKLFKDYSYYKSFQKFLFLIDMKAKKGNEAEKYLDFWPSLRKLGDIMENNTNPKINSLTVSEITLDVLQKIGYDVSPCELVLYKNKCYRPNQKCLNKFDYENYFLQYVPDSNNKRWICYYKTKEHFKNKQCSSDYGVLLPFEEINKKFLIDFIRKKGDQHLVLLKPSPSCPKPHPRTVFFSTVKDKEKEDPYQYKRLSRAEEVIITDPNYQVITNIFADYYHVKSRAAIYNNVLGSNIRGWNYNYLWRVKAGNHHDEGVDQIKNKYQLIGNYPLDHTYKDGLNKLYNKLQDKFPEDYNYIPKTYLFPEQKQEILSKFKDYQYNPNDVWLFKPPFDSFGNGIKIINDYNDIKDAKQRKYLISRYIMNPLLIKNKKFDMRAYVLVTGMNPLKIYFYRDGYLKLTVKNFTLDKEFIGDGCVHITTSDTNLECFEGKEYKYDTDIYDEKSNFYSYVYFERYCNKNGINYTDIMEQMKDIFIKTFISMNSDFLDLLKKKINNDRNLYQLYGLDLIVDQNYKVYLLELNRDPSMRDGHAVCDYMYDNIIPDILNIVGIVPFNHNETQQPLDKDIYIYDNEIEEIVDDSLCEFGRPRGMFELVYPLKNNIEKYKKFYDRIYPETALLWDKLLKSNGEYD